MQGQRKQADGRGFPGRKGKRGMSDEDNDECSARPCLHPLGIFDQFSLKLAHSFP